MLLSVFKNKSNNQYLVFYLQRKSVMIFSSEEKRRKSRSKPKKKIKMDLGHWLQIESIKMCF